MGKRRLALLCAMIFSLAIALPGFTTAERPAAEVVEGEKYISGWLPGASALYVSGEQVTLDHAYFYGAGYASDQEITDQIPNQYGLCAVVLGAGQGTEIVLNSPTIVSDPESYANGVFAAAMAKVTIHGGTIDTDNSSGHGIDATYMGHVYAYDTVIHTRGETSGALATDFGGGFVTGERLDCTTESGSSPGIFCAGSTVINLKDSRLTTKTATGIVVAHDHAVVVLDNCEVNAAGTAVSGLQALPNAASSDGSSFYAFNSKLTSAGGAVVGENGGRTVVNLISTECTAGGETAISASGSSAGILTVNLWDTALTGGIECGKNCSVTVNLYAGGKLSGEVSGEGMVEINVFDGGEYTGSFAANAAGAGEPAPIPGTFDDYLVNCWATGSSTWTESRAQQYVTKVEPAILENSAACLVADGAAAKAYDPAVYNPSETGVDLSLLNVGGAHGFMVEEIFGSGTEMPEGFSGFPDAPGDGFGESSGAPAGGSTAAKAGMGDSPAAVIIYRNDQSSSPNADFDCGLAVQNMAIAAASMGYGVKIISSPTMTLNGANHDAICEKLGVDASLQAVAVLLIGTSDNSEDAVSGASTRDSLETRTTIIE